MARESAVPEVTEYADGIRRGRNSVFSSWEWFARTAVFAQFIQGSMLVFLYYILEDGLAGASLILNPDRPSMFFYIVMLTAFLYRFFLWVTGPSARTLYAVANIDFQHHPCPKKTRSAAYLMYTLDLLLGMTTGVMGLIYIVSAMSKEALLLNALAVFFILGIDDAIAALTPSIGMMHDIQVPEHVVLPKYIYDAGW